MATSEQEASFYAAQTVAKLFENDALRQQFMQAYNSGKDDIEAFLTGEMGMPDDLAAKIASQQDQELSDYIGKLVCNYLW